MDAETLIIALLLIFTIALIGVVVFWEDEENDNRHS